MSIRLQIIEGLDELLEKPLLVLSNSSRSFRLHKSFHSNSISGTPMRILDAITAVSVFQERSQIDGLRSEALLKICNGLLQHFERTGRDGMQFRRPDLR